MKESTTKSYAAPVLEVLSIRDTQDIDINIGIGIGLGLGS